VAEYMVDIVTPERLAWSGGANELRAPGWDGQFTALPGHDLFMSLLRAGLLVVVDAQGAEHKFVTGRGFAEISAERATVVVDSARPAANVNKDAAKKRLAELEVQLLESNGWGEAHDILVAKAELAQAELDA
jgi:F-type H+-transporting ATPase subunit epsilon